MLRHRMWNRSRLRPWSPLAPALLALLLAVPARGEVVLTVQDVTAESGTSGNALEVLLTNTGPSAIDVAAFSFGISVATADVVFTAADTATASATYLFDGISAFGPDIRLPGQGEGQVLDASDADDTLSGVSVGAGGTFSLGRVLFRVAAGAESRDVAVALAAFPATSLSDPDLSDIPIGDLQRRHDHGRPNRHPRALDPGPLGDRRGHADRPLPAPTPARAAPVGGRRGRRRPPLTSGRNRPETARPPSRHRAAAGPAPIGACSAPRFLLR